MVVLLNHHLHLKIYINKIIQILKKIMLENFLELEVTLNYNLKMNIKL